MRPLDPAAIAQATQGTEKHGKQYQGSATSGLKIQIDKPEQLCLEMHIWMIKHQEAITISQGNDYFLAREKRFIDLGTGTGRGFWND